MQIVGEFTLRSGTESVKCVEVRRMGANNETLRIRFTKTASQPGPSLAAASRGTTTLLIGVGTVSYTHLTLPTSDLV